MSSDDNEDTEDDGRRDDDSDDVQRDDDDPAEGVGGIPFAGRDGKYRWEGEKKSTDLERTRPHSVDTATTGPPPPPRGSRAGGRRLWHSVVDGYELDEHELALLTEAVRTVDALDALDTRVRRDGVIVGDKVNPSLVEARQLRIVLARLLAGLRLPAGEQGDEQASARPQRRSGYRGTYGITGAVR